MMENTPHIPNWRSEELTPNQAATQSERLKTSYDTGVNNITEAESEAQRLMAEVADDAQGEGSQEVLNNHMGVIQELGGRAYREMVKLKYTDTLSKDFAARHGDKLYIAAKAEAELDGVEIRTDSSK